MGKEIPGLFFFFFKTTIKGKKKYTGILSVELQIFSPTIFCFSVLQNHSLTIVNTILAHHKPNDR